MQVQLVVNVDAIIVTHTHRDHFDDAAVSTLPKHLPLFCQPEDENIIKEKVFTNVMVVYDEYMWQGIRLNRTIGKHGTGELAEKMGPVSGFVLCSLTNLYFILSVIVFGVRMQKRH
jgi:L-ascorbate metabolism protein UlaG (beta-lactamase superfamily)